MTEIKGLNYRPNALWKDHRYTEYRAYFNIYLWKGHPFICMHDMHVSNWRYKPVKSNDLQALHVNIWRLLVPWTFPSDPSRQQYRDVLATNNLQNTSKHTVSKLYSSQGNKSRHITFELTTCCTTDVTISFVGKNHDLHHKELSVK